VIIVGIILLIIGPVTKIAIAWTAPRRQHTSYARVRPPANPSWALPRAWLVAWWAAESRSRRQCCQASPHLPIPTLPGWLLRPEIAGTRHASG
jgi:hypothetical protein